MSARFGDVDWGYAPECAEFATDAAMIARRVDIRPVYCPSCGKHYTASVDERHRVATVVHYVCGPCGGDGTPASLEVPR